MVLIAVTVIFLFGSNKLPQVAKAIGQAGCELDQASRELTNPYKLHHFSNADLAWSAGSSDSNDFSFIMNCVGR